MLVLSYPKKNSALFLMTAILATCLLAFSSAKGQSAESVVINPDGGNSLSDGLRITITDTAILVRKNGVDQYNLDGSFPREDRGLKTYVILEQRFGDNSIKTPAYLKACEISGIYGAGTSANPWKVAVLNTMQNSTGAAYNVTIVYTYVKGDAYYLADFYITGHENTLTPGDDGGPYYYHIYFSEHTWINGTDCGAGYESQTVPSATERYYDDFGLNDIANLPQTVGVLRVSGDCDGTTGAHLFKTNGGFTSYWAGAPSGRDSKVNPGYRLQSQVNAVAQSMGIAVHKAVEVIGVPVGKVRSVSKRFAIGFDKSEIEGLTLTEPPLIMSTLGYPQTMDAKVPATIELSSAISSGPEGNNIHSLTGLTLKVHSGGLDEAFFNAPQIAYVRVVTTGTGTGHAIPGTDYEERITKVIIPPGYYQPSSASPTYIPLDSILVKGDAFENPDKTMTVELLPTCSPYLQIGTIQSSTYTIVDDDENKISIEPQLIVLPEGQSMKIKIKMTGTPLPSPLVVTLSKDGALSDAEDADHSVIPSTVTIPAGQFEAEFDFDATPDRILEPLEEILALHASAVFGAETRTADTTLKIIDTTQNNPANKTIYFSAPEVKEGVSTTVTASLPVGVSTEEPVVISMPTVLVSPSTASLADFSPLPVFPATVTIGAFASSATFNVNAQQDGFIEPDEEAFFNATVPADPAFTVQQGKMVLKDNEPNKQITIAFDQSVIMESGMATGTITLPYPTSAPLDVTIFKDPASTADNDDINIASYTVHFNAFNNTATFDVEAIFDTWLEHDEDVTIGGTFNDYIVTPATFTITDFTSFFPEYCEITLTPDATSMQEGNTMNVKVKLPDDVYCVDPITIDLSKGGNSSLGLDDLTDYILPATVTINPGDNEATFTITAKPDDVIEPMEQLEIASYVEIFGNVFFPTALIDINDETGADPDNRKITVTSPLTVQEGNTLQVVFSLPAGITATDPIDIILNVTNVGAGFTEDADFGGGIPMLLTIQPGDNQVIWTADPVVDGIFESTEHLIMQASATDYTVNDNNPIDLELTDLTAGGPGTPIIFTTTATDMTEGGTGITVTATLQSGTAPAPITITLDKLSGTTASDDDFSVSPTTITIGAGDPSTSFVITPETDNKLERREVLKLGGIATGYTIQDVTLNIDDATGLTFANKQITLAPEAAAVTEGNTIKVWAQLPMNIITTEDITVTLSRGTGTVAALLAAEYVLPATVVIPAGQNKASFDLEAKPDGVIEQDEKLEIKADATVFDEAVTTSGDVNIADATGTAANKTISLSTSASVTEGNSVVITFSLPSGITSTQDIVINLAQGSSTPATDADDFDPALPVSVTIPANSNSVPLTIAAKADGIIETTEKLHLVPAAADGYTFASDILMNVIDNDMVGAGITITRSAANVTEGDAVTITATLNGSLTTSSDIVVAITKLGSSTASATDHTALTNITIPANSSSGNITMTASLDDLLEPAELVVIEGTAAGFTVLGTTITIDDKNGQTVANKLFTVAPEATSVAEGGAVKVWIRLPSPQKTQDDLVINLQSGTLTSATLQSSEYNLPASVTIPAGQSEMSFMVDALPDFLIEGTEQLDIEASAMVYGTSVTASEKIDITDVNSRLISVSAPASVTEGTTGSVTFSLQAGLTTEQDIIINLATGSATPATGAADFDPALESSVTILAGGSSTTLTIPAKADGIIEPTEKLDLIPAATGFTFSSNVQTDIIDNSGGAVIDLSASAATIAEGGTATTITATLQGGLIAGSAITITLGKDINSTADNTDHGTLNTITILAGATSGSTTINASTDLDLEQDETLILTGEATGFTVNGTTLTITDATGPKQITLTPDATTVTEGNIVKIWVSLPTGIITTQPITVQLAAAASSDYVLPTSVIIPAGANTISFDFEAKTDLVLETPETVTINAEATVFGTLTTTSTNVDIIDASATPANTLITVTNPASITEGNTGTITFSLPTGVTSTQDIIINLATGSATPATGAGDFDPALESSVTILAGGSNTTLTIPAKADGIIEPTEKLDLIPAATGFTFSSNVQTDIIDNSGGAVIDLSASAATIAEGGTATTITATLQGGLTAGSAITITVGKDINSTADNTDHSTLNTITILSGATSGSTTISASTDLDLEQDETLILTGEATGFTVNGTTLTITDATGPKQITLTPDATTVTEGNIVKIWVSLPTGIITTQPITVQLTAAASLDYLLPTSVIIPAGANTISFDFEAKTDLVLETQETVAINAEATVFGTLTTTSTNVDIIDASATPANTLITVTNPASITEGNTGTITFSLPTGVTSTQDIIISLATGSATPATAAADFDPALVSSVTILAGASSATLTIPAKADGIIESTEKLHLLPSATGFTFSQDALTDIIDENVTGNITITSSTTSIQEGGSVATITVSLPGALLAGSDIQVDLNRGIASTASSTDHSTLPAYITIKTGDHSATFDVSAATDNILEPTENLVIEGAATSYSVSAATIQVTDATSLNPANTVISLLPDGSTIQEGNTAHFAVSLPAGIVSSTPITVNMSKTAVTSTAADTDHTQVPASIVIPAMTGKSADFNISAVTDMILEPQETLKVDGAVPAGFTFNGAQIYIDDATGLDPANKQITITIDSTILHEGNTSKVTFALPTGITTATDIAIAITADAAFSAGNADYILPTVIIPKDDNKVEVVLQAVQDNTTEATEVLNLSASATGFTFISSGKVTIPGDAAPSLTVQAVKTTDAAEPGTNGVFTIQLTGSAIAPADIVVNYTVGGTATADTDYTALAGQATIPAGQNSVTIPVIVSADQLVEGNETITITLQSGSYTYLGSPATCAMDNTVPEMTLTDRVYDTSILIEKLTDATEPNTAGSIKVRFRANITATAPVTVTYTVTGTATPGTDYTALSGTVIIPAGDQRITIPVQPMDDNIKEGNETVILTLTGATSTIPGIAWSLAAEQEDTVNIIDNDLVTMEVFAPAQAAEGGVLAVKLRASQVSPVDIPVTVTLQHDATRNVTPAVPQSGTTLTVIMPANQTEINFNMQLEDNDTNDDDGFVNLIIEPQPSGQQYGKGSSSNTATLITDNDPLEIRFRKDTVRIMEGHTGTTPMIFTVELSRKSSRAITLHYAFGDAFEGEGVVKDPQRANSGEDYFDGVTSIVIPPLQDAADIIIQAFGDVGAEEDEYFSIEITSAIVTSKQNAPAIGTAKKAIGAIMNDDMAIDMEIRVHNALSPNNDGKNDVLIIDNIEKYARNEIVIMNRWGGAIFKTSSYNNSSNNFKGRANAGGGSGNELTDGSYFYILNVWDSNGKLQRFTGYIVLKHSN